MTKQNFYYLDTEYLQNCNKTQVQLTLVDFYDDVETTETKTLIGFYDGEPDETKTLKALQEYDSKQRRLAELLDECDKLERMIQLSNIDGLEHMLHIAEMQVEAISIILDTAYDESYVQIVQVYEVEVLNAQAAFHWMRIWQLQENEEQMSIADRLYNMYCSMNDEDRQTVLDDIPQFVCDNTDEYADKTSIIEYLYEMTK